MEPRSSRCFERDATRAGQVGHGSAFACVSTERELRTHSLQSHLPKSAYALLHKSSLLGRGLHGGQLLQHQAPVVQRLQKDSPECSYAVHCAKQRTRPWLGQPGTDAQTNAPQTQPCLTYCSLTTVHHTPMQSLLPFAT